MNQRNSTFVYSFWLILIIVVFWSQLIIAQEKTVTVKAGQSISDVVSKERIYRFPGFKTGTVHYKTGNILSANLNYNIILGDMMFINTKKDTLTITNRNEIDFISVNTDTIYAYDKGYFAFLSGNEHLKLISRQYLKLTDIRSKGAYGTSTSTSSVENLTSLNGNLNTNTFKLKVDQDMVYTFKEDFLFRLPDGSTILANKNNLIKEFPENKEAINKFIKDQSVRFNNAPDLIRITNFINQLQQR